MNRGILYAALAYAIWGLFPIYWKWLAQVPALQVISHRVLWSCLLLVIAVTALRRWRALRAALSLRVIGIYLAAAALVSVNWLVYIWAVNAGFVIETSLGYFINPLLSVLMGVLLLRERLAPWQWLPVMLATAGVLYLTFAYGALPWIALTLAFTFAAYGLIKKTAPLNSLQGLTLETSLMLLPALLYLGYCEYQGNGAFLHVDALSHLLLFGSGLVTIVPLLLFASAAQRIPLSAIGILQYIAPTIQFLLGVLLYGEPMSEDRLIGFGLVWAALVIFAAGSVLAQRARAAAR